MPKANILDNLARALGRNKLRKYRVSGPEFGQAMFILAPDKDAAYLKAADNTARYRHRDMMVDEEYGPFLESELRVMEEGIPEDELGIIERDYNYKIPRHKHQIFAVPAFTPEIAREKIEREGIKKYKELGFGF